MTEINPNEKFKHLSKIGPTILQCISCGDCREATDYTSDPQKMGRLRGTRSHIWL